MFNITTPNSVGYNGISQIQDGRCTPPYDVSPGDKLRAYLHNEVQTGVLLPEDRKILKGLKSSDPVKSHPLEDVYTFNETQVQCNQTKPRLAASPLHKNNPIFNKDTPDWRVSLPALKQLNGYNSPEKNIVHNGVGDGIALSSPERKDICSRLSSSIKQQSNTNALFPNLAMRDERKVTEYNVDTKNSIIKHNTLDGHIHIISDTLIYDKLNIKETIQEDAIKTEPMGTWCAEGRVVTPLFSSSYKPAPTASQRKAPSGKPSTPSPRSRRGRGPALHEALQRISTHNTLSTRLRTSSKGITTLTSTWMSPSSLLFDCSPLDVKLSDTTYNNYIQPWLEGVGGCEPGLGRAERLATRRATLRRRTTQLSRYSQTLQASYVLQQNVKVQVEKSPLDTSEIQSLPQATLDRILAARGYTTLLSAFDRKRIKSGGKLLGGGECMVSGCLTSAMSCAVYCSNHMLSCRDQKLFSSCTAKFSDNTQCKVPVINITNHLPLCDEHARKRDNYNKISQELKPKKAPRKRPKPSAMIRPQKRNRKRKKGSQSTANDGNCKSTGISALASTQGSTSSGCEESAEEAGIGLTEEFIEAANSHHIVDEEVVAQVLGLQVEETRAPSQDGNIDLTAVFNDLFTAEQNEEYVPTREETEELERALEAVNQDVKSLEKLTASQSGSSLLDSFLDERALAETLASLPDVFSPSPNCTA